MKKLILTLLLFIVAMPAMAQEQSHENHLRKVEAKYVCMVNDKAFQSEQIPVGVDGTTYYGCCSMCEVRLQKDPAIRLGVDPVSNNSIDKTKAIIGADMNNAVYYFESEENFNAFQGNEHHDDALETKEEK